MCGREGSTCVYCECCGELGSTDASMMEIVEMAKRISFALISRISTRYYVGTSTKYGSADIAI